MGQITTDQSHAVMAVLTTNTDWSSIDFDLAGLQDAIIRDPKGAGQRFTAFIKTGCRFISGDQKSAMAKPFNPAEFIGEGWTTWKGPADGNGLSGDEDIDPRSLALTEVDFTSFCFETCFNTGEKSITGEEKLRRLKEKKPDFIRFGGTVFHLLWLDYNANKENSILEWLHGNRGVTFMDFMGQILRGPDGDRRVLSLRRFGDGEWNWYYYWLDREWGADAPSVGCASQSSDV